MDRLVESLSHVLSKGKDYRSNDFVVDYLNSDNFNIHPQSQKSSFCANLPDINKYSSIYGRKTTVGSDPITSKNVAHVRQPLQFDIESDEFQSHRKQLKDDHLKNSSSPSKKPSAIRESKSTLNNSKLGSEDISKLIKNDTLHSFKTLENTEDEKRTIFDIAIKYSPEDITLSKVRGVFMDRYSRDSLSHIQTEVKKGEHKKCINGELRTAFKNVDAETAYRDIEEAFSQAIDDCYARFFTNLPVNLLEDAIHLYFQIQAAYWWYEDMWYDKYSHILPKLSLRVFGQFVAEDCPILRHFVSSPEEHDKFLLNWKRYCKTIPLRGVILINKELSKCVLVKPWNGSKFMFPRGKMDEMEEDSLCAIREAYEELGIDVTKHLNDSLYIEKLVEEQTIKLFIIPGIDENTPLEPKKRKEISEIRWFNLTSLPNWQSSGSSARQKKTRNNNILDRFNNLIDDSSEYLSDNEKQEHRLSDDESQQSCGKNSGSLSSNKTDYNLFFRVSHFTRNLRGWIEILKKIQLENPNVPGSIIPHLPKNLNPAVVRRLQNADLGGPPLSTLPLFVRVKTKNSEKKANSSSLAVQGKKKSRPSILENASRDKRTFGTRAGSGWNVEAMFALNEEKFGVKSTFSIDEYTIPLPKSNARK
ncbi:ataxin2 related nudix domain (RNA processing phosphatase ATpase domain) [Cryptosporidium bovis]|uniref:ataxin2 related nudix domain (RNA processing phosphatase ATpase domain) n=1 Tax=Cryptosporidium bovis TaxID=310047 RepID=UPI00351A418C|nr:ataxin2 related nudix domain (RNA processing phosphatase ATpase domain) [Cryptosporidium bovis]